MPILRDAFAPTVTSEVVAAPKRRRNLMQPDFYGQQQQDPQQQQIQQVQQQAGPTTQDYIVAGLQKMAGRAAPPELQPNARVQMANQSLVQPSNFKSFYDMLGSITDRGTQQLNAATSRAAYQRAQQASSIAGQVGGGSSSGGGGGGTPFTGGVPSNPAANFKFAQNIAGNYGWGGDQLAAWYRLGMKESGWRNNAQNPHSTAYGIGQFLDSTWKGYGIGKTSDAALQVEAMARYIRARYGTPQAALAFHNAHNWY